MNRDPADELIREGQVITLQVPVGIKKNVGVAIGIHLVRDLTRAAHNMIEKRLESYWKACWQSSRPIIIETIESITHHAQNCMYPIKDIDFGWGADKLRETDDPFMPSSILNLVVSLERHLYEDIEDYLFGAVCESSGIDEFKAAVKSEFSLCRRKIRKIIQKTESKFFSLDPDYEVTLRRMEYQTESYRINQQILKKISNLSVAAHFYIRNCMPPKYQDVVIPLIQPEKSPKNRTSQGVE